MLSFAVEQKIIKQLEFNFIRRKIERGCRLREDAGSDEDLSEQQEQSGCGDAKICEPYVRSVTRLTPC